MVNTAEPFEVAEIEKDYFPNISIESISKAIEFYQKLGTWDKDIKIEPELYEKALDVFEFSNLIKSRYDYDDVVFND